MKRLRAQVTALLVVAMLVVLAVANAATFFLSGPPQLQPDEIDAITDQMVLTAELAGREPVLPASLARVLPAPPEGRELPDLARLFEASLARLGKGFPVRAVEARGGPPLIALGLPDGRWLVMRSALRGPPGGPPPGFRTWSLAMWLVLLTAGTTLAVVVAARRLMRPLALIEEAAARVGPDGELPALDESGPSEVKAAAAAINLLSRRLKGAMESRMRIVAAAAHDFRTPLTRMRLRAEFIPDDEERAQWLSDLAELDRIADSAIRLVREEVEGGADEPVALDALVRTVIAEMDEMGRPARLLAADAACVSGRALALKRAVRNLVLNAATHGGGAQVTLRCEAGMPGGGRRVRLAIADHGPGIPEALMGQVFEPFFRVDPARQAKIPGAGLGLAIAREIITRHGGRLTLTNQPGGGLLQEITLPMLEAGEGA